MKLKGPTELNEALDLFLMFLTDRNASPNTILCYKSDLDKFQQSLHAELGPEIMVQEISRASIERFLTGYAGNGRSPSAVNRMKSAISQFFGYLVDIDFIKYRPFGSLGVERIVPKPVRPLGPPERRRLAKVASAKKDVRLLVALFLDRGLSVLEAVKLDVSDVKDKEVLRITGKTGQEKSLPIGKDSSIRRLIDEWLKERAKLLSAIRHNKTAPMTRTDREALFISKNGQRRSIRSVQSLFKECFTRAGLKWLSIRKLRDAFGKRMAARFPYRTVEAALGRKDHLSVMLGLSLAAPKKDVIDAVIELDKSSPTLNTV